MAKIKLDLNNNNFQSDLINLEKTEIFAFTKTLRKIMQLSWQELYADNGLKWEAIKGKQTMAGEKIYTFRFSQKYRATALREGDFLRILALCVDHDSAY